MTSTVPHSPAAMDSNHINLRANAVRSVLINAIATKTVQMMRYVTKWVYVQQIVLNVAIVQMGFRQVRIQMIAAPVCLSAALTLLMCAQTTQSVKPVNVSHRLS